MLQLSESVNDTDSVRFTSSVGITNVAVTESVNDTDSVRFTSAAFDIESVKRYRFC